MSLKQLIIVDDDRAIITALERVLRSPLAAWKVVITTFSHPEDVLNYVRLHGLPDALLTDDLMPGMTGRELVRELRGMGFTGKIVMLSGTADDEVLAQGVDILLQKPFDVPALRTLICDLFTQAPCADQPFIIGHSST